MRVGRGGQRRGAASVRACVVAALVVVLPVAGCGGDGDGERSERHELGKCTAPETTSPAPAAKARSKALNRDDFDGDGRHDLLLEGFYKKPRAHDDRNRSLLLGSANGAAAGRQLSLADRFPGLDGRLVGQVGGQVGGQAPALTGDWDADGRADILLDDTRDASGIEEEDPRYEGQIVWGGGSGVDGRLTRLPITEAPHVASADFDGDGALDLLSGSYEASEDWRNDVRCVAIDFGPFDREGQEKERRFVDITRHGSVYTESLTVGDFDGDGRAEFLTHGFRVEGEDGPDTYPSFYVDASYYRVGPDRTVSRADDLKGFQHGKDVRYDPAGGGLATPPQYAPSELLPRLAADFDGDGRADVLRDGLGDAPRQVVYGGPAGPGTGRAATEAPAAGDTGAVGDVNGDGRDDLVIAHTSGPRRAGHVAVFLGGEHGLARDASHTFDRGDVGMSSAQPGDDQDRDQFGSELTVTDLDGDGCAELAVHTQDFRSVGGKQGTYWIIPGSPHGPVPDRAHRLDAWRVGRD